MSFESFNLDSTIMQGIQAQGFTTPTPIQEKAIPLVIEGRDVMGLAQTGTGKTAAFVLPILQRLLHGPRRRIRALIIAPTRELAEQTNESIKQLGAHTGIRSIVIYGGVKMNPQIQQLRSGKGEIIVACPGRLLDHIGQGTLSISQVEILVLDEADRMLDMGFMPDIKRILRYIKSPRQTLMFSATMPDDINKLASKVLSNHVTIQIGQSAPAQNVTHKLFTVESHLKSALLKAMLHETGDGPILIFTRTKIRADRVGLQLKRAGFCATTLQGGMTQSRRQAALEGFRSGKYKVLVATDVAARGIDVENISHVINFDLPENVDAYIHRVGRTGRASKTGKAYSIVTAEDGPTVQAFESALDVELVNGEIENFQHTASKPFRSREPKNQRSHQTHSKRRNSRSERKR